MKTYKNSEFTNKNNKNYDKSLNNRKRFTIFSSCFSLIIGLSVLAFSAAIIAFSVWANTKEVNKSLLPTASAVPTFYDVNGNQINYIEDDYIKDDEIPENLKNAFVALEDKRFYQHDGYDTYRILGATVNNLKSGKVVEGASTITQQLVKNTHLSSQKTLKRKLNEIAIATQIEKEYQKDEILSMYLSVIYFGGGAYGVKSASRLYFSKDVKDLSLSECAMLAGIVKNPTGYSPVKNHENALKRRNLVLDIMKNQGYLTDGECENAKNDKLVVKTKNYDDANSFYINCAIKEVCEKLNITKYQLSNSGYKIFTNLNTDLQKELNHLKNDNSISSENAENECVIIENNTGKILAHVSTLDYAAKRQVGSTLKPLVVYSPAFEENMISLCTPVVDEKITIGGWSPENFGGKYLGEININDAIKHSSNSVSAQIGNSLGIDKMTKYGNKFGLSLSNESIALSLGATQKGISPLQLAVAYSAFANNGNLKEYSYVNFIADNGKKIYAYTPSSKRIISEETAYLTAYSLINTVKDGTAKTLSTLGFEVASKTGTTDKKGKTTDAINVSFTPDYTVSVWHGGENINETGGGLPTMHAKKIYQYLYQNYTPQKFNMPENVITLDVDTYSTAKNKTVTLATEYTPKRFKQTSIFCKNNIPSVFSTAFEKANPELNVKVIEQNKVILTTYCDEIYTMEISRIDDFGTQTILKTNDFENNFVKNTPKCDKIELIDHPFTLTGKVCYKMKLYCENRLVGETVQTVFLNEYDFFG